MSPPPKFSVTGNLFDLPGINDGTNLVVTPMPQSTTLVFTHNVRLGYPVTWEGDTYGLPEKVVVAVNPDGSISSPGDPVLLLANDSGLNVTRLQWTATLVRPGRASVPWTFDAPGNGETLPFSSIVRVPAVPATDITVTMDMVYQAIADAMLGGGGGGVESGLTFNPASQFWLVSESGSVLELNGSTNFWEVSA